MSLRKLTSLLLVSVFLFLTITGIILFIVPQGRVAYWSNWTLLGISKSNWGLIHINFGILFLISGLLHIYYNWKPLVNYLKNKSKNLIIVTPPLIATIIITLSTFLGTAFNIPPFSYVDNLESYIKELGEKKYGNPPYGHAEQSTIEFFTKRQEIDLHYAIKRLNLRGIKVLNNKQTLNSISENSGVSPKELYIIMRGEKIDESFPHSPFPGFGNMRLIEICQKYTLNCKKLLIYLKDSKISCVQDMTVKEIGEKNSTQPMRIFEEISNFVKKKAKPQD